MANVYYKGSRLPDCSPAVARKLIRAELAIERYRNKETGAFGIEIKNEQGLSVYQSSFTCAPHRDKGG